MKKILLFAGFAMLMTSSCNSGKNLSSMMNLLKAKWALQSLTGQSSDLGSIFGQKIPFLNFDTDAMRVAGNAGCNNFNGPFSLEAGGKLSFGNLAMTKRACPGNGESLFTSALNKVTNFKIDNNVLTLLEGKNKLMEFVRE
jgi:heat shock protein HslJ